MLNVFHIIHIKIRKKFVHIDITRNKVYDYYNQEAVIIRRIWFSGFE